jgi:predicted O-methyltransferase YrrM
MNQKLEEYINEHISPEDELLEELYHKTHTSVINPNMVSGHLQGKVLEMIISMLKPDLVLEIGTYTGYSAIAMAGKLEAGALLHTIEVNDELHELSSSYIEKAGLKSRIIMHTGDAKTIIPEIKIKFDLVFIDGDKREYPDYYDIVFPHVKTGGFILADNVLWDGKVADIRVTDPMTDGIRAFNSRVRNDDRVEKVILPLRDGLMLIRKLRD